MTSFYKKETNLLDRWYYSYSKEERDYFCYDGLIYSRDPNNDDKYEHEIEAEKWENAKRKVLFLLKDTNDFPNDDADYRFSRFYDTDEARTYKTFVVLLKWLWALNEVTPENLPRFDKTREEYITAAQHYPMAIVNVKKIVGGSYVDNLTLWKYFEHDKKLIKEQICEILKPNIIVCGGGSGTLLEMAKRLYDDKKFEKKNDWCYFCSQNGLILIDSYHPSYRCSDELKFDMMIKNVQNMQKAIVKKV